MVRVLHVIPSVSPKRGGPSLAVLAMVRALRAQGVGAEIATTNDDGEEVLDVPLGEFIEHAGVPVRFFSRFSPSARAVREFAYSPGLTRWLKASVRNYGLFHVHAIFSYPSTCAMSVARRCGLPYLNRPLGQLCEWSLRRSRLKKRAYMALVERANLNAAAGLHYMTEQEQREAQPLGLRAPGFVAPHGIDLPVLLPDARAQLRQRLDLPADAKLVLFLSRVHPKKGLELLIPALARLRDEPIYFVLVGNAEPPGYEAEVERMLAAAGMTARTRRVPFATGEWKQILLQGADVFALTSHSENFGLAVVEAFAAQLPVVVTPGVALAEQVRRHQLGEVADLDETSIAAALCRLLGSDKRRAEMGRHARELVEQEYAWPAIAARIGQEYRRISGTAPLNPSENHG
jgi:glycosyltransferase involved in cell wall biosynthesis